MPALTIALPAQRAPTEFDLRRWAELAAERDLSRFEGRIETDRHGHIIMAPPPAPSHGGFQSGVAHLLFTLIPDGRVITECPISTADGVKAADVAWASPAGLRKLGNRVCFPPAPEICVEVLSPRNTAAELQEKSTLYFDAGAKEVWLCAASGAMTFLHSGDSQPRKHSMIRPPFPARVRLR